MMCEKGLISGFFAIGDTKTINPRSKHYALREQGDEDLSEKVCIV